ncbi:sulfatase [Wenyingzhuangia sp. IMCC45467]
MKIYHLILTFCLCITAFSQNKPNILIIHTDDLGYHDLSITGSELYDTPNIDALAKEAVSFTNAYSSYPRCTPSRYGMMTATYPVNENKGHLGGIPDNENFIKQFNSAGYHTSYIGKWHLGEGDSNPENFGFNYTYAAGRAGGIGSRFYPFNINSKGKRHKEQVENLEQDGKKGDYASDMLTNATIEFIEKNPKNEPFLAVLAFYAVHTPIEAKPKDEARNKEQLKSIEFGNSPEYIKEGAGRRKMRQDDAAYAGMVENVDENVGRILNKLKELGIDKNTIIVFSSDHGGLSNDGNKGERHLATSNNPLRAGKGWLYEGGIRVPLFVKWGNELKPHVDDKSIVLGMDVFPTLLDLALDKQVQGVDGMSYKNVLKEKECWSDRTVFWNSNKARPHSTGDPKTMAVRSGDYKLLFFKETDTYELYNLKEDVSEENDLSAKNSKKLAEMKTVLKSLKKQYMVPERMDVGKKKQDKKDKK